KPKDSLPDPAQLWAWAHVQINNVPGGEMADPSDTGFNDELDKIKDRITANRNTGVSRIICPRKLKPDTQYFAFVIPTFEAGRRAGLKEDLTDVNYQKAAWEVNGEIPV